MPVPSFVRKIDELLRPCNGEERRSGREFFGWKLHRLPSPDFMRVHIPMVQTEKRFYERVFTSISYSFTRLFSTRRRRPSQFNEWNLNLLVACSGSTTHVSPNCIDTWRVSSLRFFSPCWQRGKGEQRRGRMFSMKRGTRKVAKDVSRRIETLNTVRRWYLRSFGFPSRY